MFDRTGSNQLSYSKIATYLDCPKKYWYNYFSPVEKIPPSLALVFGSCIHKALEINDLHIINHGNPLGSEKCKGEFENVYNEEIKTCSLKDSDNPSELRDRGFKLIEEYYKEKIYAESEFGFKPILAEHQFNISLNRIPGIELMGYVDYITEDGKIVDRKTSASSYSMYSFLEKRLQLGIYAIYYRKTFGKKETACGLDVLVKTKAPKVQILEYSLADSEVEEILTTIDVVQKSIKEKKFHPSYKNCSWCDFKDCCAKSSARELDEIELAAGIIEAQKNRH